MQTKDFTTQHTVRYLSNKNNFSKQPLFLLANNMGLTGDDFIAVYRITRGQGFAETFRESAAISDTGAANAISGEANLLFDGTIPHAIRPQSVAGPKFRITISMFYND